MLEDKLCKCCRVVISTNDKLRHDHHANVEELFAAAAGGCPLCTILCDCFRRSSFQENAEGGELIKINFEIGEDYSTDKRVVMICFTVCFPNRPLEKKTLPERLLLQNILVIPADGKQTFTFEFLSLIYELEVFIFAEKLCRVDADS